MSRMCMLLQHSVENAEHLIKRLESFITMTMDANDDRINSVVALGRQLIAENNYASDKIQQKADSLEDRWRSYCLTELIVLLQWLYLQQHLRLVFTSDNGEGICFRPRSFVLGARLLKNACIDLDEMLHVDRCQDMVELINFCARSGS